MVDYKATYTDISTWDINRYVGTGGTRSKEIAIHPDTEKQYFFKASKIDKFDTVKYPTEFWSEIVSSKVGQALGFNMLDYNIAYNENNRQTVGCISESMVEYEENKLTEGITYLRGFDPQYDPGKDQDRYTFQFICDTLSHFKLDEYIIHIIEIIIYDSIIGNSDRHQENWGTISYFREAIASYERDIESGKDGWFERLFKRLNHAIAKTTMKQHENPQLIKHSTLVIQNEIAPNSFAPIYDSGCCLAREKVDNKVTEMLKNQQMLEAYVKKGCSEIRWHNSTKKSNHFELVELVMLDHGAVVKKIITQVKEKYNQEILKGIIYNIDSELPDMLKAFKLSSQRKELMYKLITLRLEKLFILVE
jgi:hypothetical protein